MRLNTSPLPALFTIEESERQTQIIWGEDNTFKRYLVEKGDVDSVWAKADYIVEGEYTTGAQEQLYIENNGVIASFDAEHGITLWGSLQCPYYVHKALMKLCELPEDKVRVVQMETGGAFGGKEEYPSMIAGHAALLAMKSGKPVKIVYDRMEDMAATTKRHPSRTRHRTAVDRDGKILGGEIEFVIDGGAYATLSSVVLSRGTIHAGGPYYWPSIRIRAKAVATNAPPHGAFRGFGAPQSLFAMERHMDRIAATVGISPVDIRRRNFLKTGQTTTTEQMIREPIDLDQTSRPRARTSPTIPRRGSASRHEKRGRDAQEGNRDRRLSSWSWIHGIGRALSCVRRGRGGCADGRRARAGVEHGIRPGNEHGALPDRSGNARAAVRRRRNRAARHREVPNSGPTVASRTVMVVGKLVQSAARGIQQTLIAVLDSCLKDNIPRRVSRGMHEVRSRARRTKIVGAVRSTARYFLGRREVSRRGLCGLCLGRLHCRSHRRPDTYSVTVDDFVALQEVGKFCIPCWREDRSSAESRRASDSRLYEKVVWHNGRMQNGQMTNYIMPTSADLPPIRVYFEELGNVHGAFGAKGIGELPMDGPAPAIVNAIEDALDMRFDSIPLLPEDIFAAMTRDTIRHRLPATARSSMSSSRVQCEFPSR